MKNVKAMVGGVFCLFVFFYFLFLKGECIMYCSLNTFSIDESPQDCIFFLNSWIDEAY